MKYEPEKCNICHRKMDTADTTTALFLVAGVETKLPAHQKCIDRDHARQERDLARLERKHQASKN